MSFGLVEPNLNLSNRLLKLRLFPSLDFVYPRLKKTQFTFATDFTNCNCDVTGKLTKT